MASAGLFAGFASGHQQTTSGADVYYLHRVQDIEATPYARKPLLILLHGFPQNNLMWKNSVQHLPSDWNVMIFDLPGYAVLVLPIF